MGVPVRNPVERYLRDIRDILKVYLGEKRADQTEIERIESAIEDMDSQYLSRIQDLEDEVMRLRSDLEGRKDE